MRRYQLSLALFFVLALVVTGCAKKSAQQASITGPGTGTGFDSLSSSEELAQLPQSGTSNTNPQGGVEVLPVETSPVTQGAPLSAASNTSLSIPTSNIPPVAETALSCALNHEQKIQTALKNAGVYNGAIDGKIGPASKRAIEAFQKSNGLKADGKVGPKTWAALEPYLSGRVPSAGPAAGATSANADQ